ncbi:MAG TPA: PH domain-containing protein, partial [Chloroflexota bacterium]|nr:PH domain-containing protein [Chloroflexota bacterium]
AEFPREKDEVARFDVPPLFAMRLPRLLLAGIFNFSLLFLTLIAGVVEFAAPLMGFDLVDHHRWMSRLGAAADRLSVSAILGIATALLFLGLLGGVAQTLARDYRFRLLRTETGFHRRRGLLTVSEAAFPADRVQVAILQTGPIRRLLGWFRLEFQTLGSAGNGAGHQVVAPLARLAEILPILNELHLARLPPIGAYVKVSRRLVLHRSVEYLAILGAAVIAAGLLWPASFLLLTLFPMCVAIAELQWRHHSYCIGPDAVHVRNGVFSQRLWAIPLANVQAITVTRSLAQRGLRLATLTIDTAGASRFINPKIIDVEDSVADTLARSLVPASTPSNPVLSPEQDCRLPACR